MNKKLWLLLALALAPFAAHAADNISITQGSGTTLKTKDVGSGVEESQVLLSDATGLSILGVAGTANANVITIQGIASGTAVPISSASIGATGAAVPASAIYLGLNVSGDTSGWVGDASSFGDVDLQSVVGTTLLVNTGATGAGSPRVTVAQDSNTNAGANAVGTVAAGTAPSKTIVMGGVYNSSLPGPSSGQTVGLQLDSSGRLIGADVVPLGTTSDSAYAGSGTCTVIACLKGLYVAPGQATMSASLPVAIASNQSTLPIGVNTANSNTQPHICGSYVQKHITSNTDTQVLAASGSTNVYVCGYEWSATTAAGAFYFEKSSTGTCASPTQFGQTWNLAEAPAARDGNSFYRGLNTGASQQLCINTANLTGNFDVGVYYDQY